MGAEVAGLLASALVWVAAIRLATRAQRAIWREAPAEWREHPELRDPVAELLETGKPRRLDSRIYGRVLVVAIVGFMLIAVLDFELWFILLTTTTLAAFWTGSGYDRSRDKSRRFARDHGLSRPPRRRRLVAAYWTATFFVWTGFYGVGAFAGALVADVVA